jgi:LuxR family maltose regulon positive regulatory protein
MKASPVAKLTHPVVATRVLPRKRLFALLDKKRKRPVIWVSGPPGSGKTTLVTSYLEARKIPCLWYQVDKADADPATFFYYLGQAAKRASPRKKKPLPLLTGEYQQDIFAFSIRYFENLFGRLKIPSIIVFDNYQEIPTESFFHEIILEGLSRIPEGINVILVSRIGPPPPFIRLRANEMMESIGWSELRLTLKESAGIIHLRAKTRQTKDGILRLHETADGWVAGLVLMLESVKAIGAGARPHEMLSPDEIFAYFASEAFNKTDKDVQAFLLKTAFLPKMTAKMAEEITGLSHAHRILSDLTQSHYFTVKSYQMESRYEYHPLFREFLLSRAKETFSSDRLSDLIRHAAILLEQNGQTEAAISFLRQVGDWERMVRLITKYAPLMVEQGRFRPLEEWLDSLPKDVLEMDPWLFYWMGACRLPFVPSLSRPYFEQAFERLKDKSDVVGVFMAWSGIVESILSSFEDFKPLDRWIGVLEELLYDSKGFPSEEIKAPVALSMFKALGRRQPQHPEIEVWAERVLELAGTHSTISAKIEAFIHLAIYRIYVGDFQKAWSAIESVQQLAPSRDASPLALMGAKRAEAFFYNRKGESHERCSKAVFDGLELCRKTGAHVMDHMLLAQVISSALNTGDCITAGNFLKKMALFLGSLKPWEKWTYHLLRGREGLARGNLEQASLHAELALKISTEVGAPFSLVNCHLVKAHVMHELGKNQQAAEHLAQAFIMARRIKSKTAEFHALLAQALFALDQGEEASCLASLQKALAIGRGGGYFNTIIDRPASFVSLFSKALYADMEVEYVQTLIRKRGLTPDHIPFHLENWPWPLKIFTLGKFELLKDGKPIRFSRKPLTMLKALVAFGGKEVKEDQITDILWPEADGDVAHQSFEITLHRLRQLIGLHDAVQLHEGRITLDPRYCWVDSWAFERSVDQADASGKKEPLGRGEPEAIQQIQKAITFYRGAFLPGDASEPWTNSIRERLRSKFLRCVVKLGHHWQRVEQWEKAAECYQTGLEVDDMIEQFYQNLMILFQRLGRRTEALSIYGRCKRALSSALGVEPSPETEALHKSLLAGKNS